MLWCKINRYYNSNISTTSQIWCNMHLNNINPINNKTFNVHYLIKCHNKYQWDNIMYMMVVRWIWILQCRVIVMFSNKWDNNNMRDYNNNLSISSSSSSKCAIKSLLYQIMKIFIIKNWISRKWKMMMIMKNINSWV